MVGVPGIPGGFAAAFALIGEELQTFEWIVLILALIIALSIVWGLIWLTSRHRSYEHRQEMRRIETGARIAESCARIAQTVQEEQKGKS